MKFDLMVVLSQALARMPSVWNADISFRATLRQVEPGRKIGKRTLVYFDDGVDRSDSRR